MSALGVFDDGSGPALYVGGRFDSASGVSANHIARWDGTSWSALGAGMNTYVNALAEYDGGSGSALYVGGEFLIADGIVAHHIARWDGMEFSAIATGNGMGFLGGVAALEVFDDGSGPALYVGGDFSTVGNLVTHGIARWDGAGWSTVGLPSEHSSFDNYVGDMLVWDDGSGPALYAGGRFDDIGGAEPLGVARWDGTSWTAIGDLPRYAVALAVFDDGSGPALYAAGKYESDPTLGNVARWDGSVWSRVGDGLSDYVYALAVFDDGNGPALYAGGAFWASGNTEVWRVAKWDGSAWSPLGTGMDDRVYALTTYDDGSGLALYAGGGFDDAGGVEVNGVARWDGSNWSPVGSGIGAALDFAVFDDGSGSALYAANGHLSRWNGAEWSPVGPGPTGDIWALAGFDYGGEPALYAGRLLHDGG